MLICVSYALSRRRLNNTPLRTSVTSISGNVNKVLYMVKGIWRCDGSQPWDGRWSCSIQMGPPGIYGSVTLGSLPYLDPVREICMYRWMIKEIRQSGTGFLRLDKRGHTARNEGGFFWNVMDSGRESQKDIHPPLHPLAQVNPVKPVQELWRNNH